MNEISEVSRTVGEMAESVEAFKMKHQTALEEVSGRVDQMELTWKRQGRLPTGMDEQAPGIEQKAVARWLTGKDLDATERKALSITADGQGVTISDDWNNLLERRMFDTSPVRQVARVLACESNQLATLFTTSAFGAEWVAGDGVTTSGTTDDYPYRQTIPIFELAAQVTVTNDLLDDSAGSSGFSV